MIMQENPARPSDIPSSQSFSNYFKQKNYSDFTLVCSDEVEIPIHRVFLAQQSVVFKAMFDIEMTEKEKKQVLIDDIDSKTMDEVLHYIYAGFLRPCDTEILIKIIYAAEKYELSELKSWCIDDLMTKVSLENVLSVLEAADLHNIKRLEERCLCEILG